MYPGKSVISHRKLFSKHIDKMPSSHALPSPPHATEAQKYLTEKFSKVRYNSGITSPVMREKVRLSMPVNALQMDPNASPFKKKLDFRSSHVNSVIEEAS